MSDKYREKKDKQVPCIDGRRCQLHNPTVSRICRKKVGSNNVRDAERLVRPPPLPSFLSCVKTRLFRSFCALPCDSSFSPSMSGDCRQSIVRYAVHFQVLFSTPRPCQIRQETYSSTLISDVGLQLFSFLPFFSPPPFFPRPIRPKSTSKRKPSTIPTPTPRSNSHHSSFQLLLLLPFPCLPPLPPPPFPGSQTRDPRRSSFSQSLFRNRELFK